MPHLLHLLQLLGSSCHLLDAIRHLSLQFGHVSLLQPLDLQRLGAEGVG